MRENWFYDRYGSRKEFVLSKWHQLLNVLGRYEHDEIPWGSIERLVFVCSGNICRSAFAEAVAKAAGMEAISAGVYAIENAAANEQAIITAESMGYDLVSHRTTPIMYLVLKKTDLLVVMEPWQADLVLSNLANKHHTSMLGLSGRPVYPHITDPYGRSPEYFRNCFNYIEKSVNGLSKKIKQSG